MNIKGRYNELEKWQKSRLKHFAVTKEWKLYWSYKETFLYMNMKKREEMKTDYKPFDIVIYKPTGERGFVKSTNEIGAFVLFRIQSTASLCKYEDIELE